MLTSVDLLVVPPKEVGTGSILVGHTTQTFFDDTGELLNSTNRYYVVRGVNACGTEGP